MAPKRDDLKQTIKRSIGESVKQTSADLLVYANTQLFIEKESTLTWKQVNENISTISLRKIQRNNKFISVSDSQDYIGLHADIQPSRVQMHPRGISKLRNLGKKQFRSVDGEAFVANMQEIQDRVKKQLQERNKKYKQRLDSKRRQLEFNVGDLVMKHLWKERFPKEEYNQLKLKNIGPCKILRNFSSNSYET